MRELHVETFRAHASPFLRHHADPDTTRRVWISGSAAVIDGARNRPGDPAHLSVVTGVGPAIDLDPLLATVGREIDTPWRFTIEHASRRALPDSWRSPTTEHWHWMWTRTMPRRSDEQVEEVTSAAAIDAILDAANPDSFARPDTPGVETWLGVRDGKRLVGVGALLRQSDGTGHLRGVTVLPDYAGGGRGRVISTGLTRLALSRGSGVATLSVNDDNDPALAIYRRLGYRVAHSFASGAPAPSA
ncbi:MULTISPECIES: GNAT family N-acetyltransferase [unclassified Nocardioides]|uniref:GNAT family N-acetyltransferase n=1 Tax=unclassified Nocardioides TaxID=2615069 RepID=UPI0036193AC5